MAVHGVLLLALLIMQRTTASFTGDVRPITYLTGEEVPIRVDTLRSDATLVPVEYYALPFCRPQVLQLKTLNLGELLMGERIESSNYRLEMRRDVKCRLLECTPTEAMMTAARLQQLERFIEQGYRGHMVVDNLDLWNNGSLAWQGRCQDSAHETFPFAPGYALGVRKACTGRGTLVNNHLHFRVQYHRHHSSSTAGDDEQFVVVGFTATPYSVQHSDDGSSCSDDLNFDPADASPVTTDPQVTKQIRWSYGVTWVEEPRITWAHRWDSYLRSSFAKHHLVHFLSIVNSTVVLMALLGLFFWIMLRLRNQLDAKYGTNPVDRDEWMIQHRAGQAPKHVNCLIAAVSSGCQLLTTAVGVLFLGCLGGLTPANRGGLLCVAVLLFAVSAFVGGYVCARLLLRYARKAWAPVLVTCTALPLLFLTALIASNIIHWRYRGSRTPLHPWRLYATLMALWCGVLIPTGVLGACFGFRTSAATDTANEEQALLEYPIRQRPWYAVLVCLLSPLLPFLVVYVELRYVSVSLWSGHVYNAWGYLTVAFVLWLSACALTSMIFLRPSYVGPGCWRWQSFALPGGAGVIFAGFSAAIFQGLAISTTSGRLIFVLFSLLMSICYTLMAGAVGIFAAIRLQHHISDMVLNAASAVAVPDEEKVPCLVSLDSAEHELHDEEPDATCVV